MAIVHHYNSSVFDCCIWKLTSKAWEYFSVKSIFTDGIQTGWVLFYSFNSWSICRWVVNASDRTIIAHFRTAHGVYSIANKFPNVLSTFIISEFVLTETVSLHFDDEDRDEFLTETMTPF